MRRHRLAVRAWVVLAATSALSATVPFAVADTVEREVVATDETDDVQADDGEKQRLIDATDVTKVRYRVGEESEPDRGWSVKIRIVHAETLTGDTHKHRAFTRFAHDGDAYRLINTRDAASLFLRNDDDEWERVHPDWMSAKGSDGRLVVKFPVSALGPAFTMKNLRTRLTVTGTSIVDRASTDDDLDVYPPR